MAETCKLGEEVTNKMLGVGRGQKRIVKLGRERFDCWPLSWNKQSTVLFGWSEFEPTFFEGNFRRPPGLGRA